MEPTKGPPPRLALACLVLALPLAAHHSLAAEYDRNDAVTVEGVVKEIAWTNPHSYIYVEALEESQPPQLWTFEGYPPRLLSTNGWEKSETLNAGDQVTIQGWRAHDGSAKAHGTIVTLANGRQVMFGAQGPDRSPDGGKRARAGKGKAE